MQPTILQHWWPVTHDFGLIRSDVEAVSAKWAEMYENSGLTVVKTRLSGPLEQCFSGLEPLSPAPTTELFIATTFGWTAYFSNGVRGSDPFLPMFRLSKELGVTALRACATPENALYPATILEVYDTPEAGGDRNGYRRCIAAVNDGGRWVFEQTGTPYFFEETARYSMRRKSDRFTPDMLVSYLSNLGIPRLSDETLQPNGTCECALLKRPMHDHLQRFSLAEAKNR